MQSRPTGETSSWFSAAVKALPWFLVVAFIGFGFYSVVPPAALPIDAPEKEFSAARAVEHVKVIAREPHPMGSTAIVEVRSYLVAELEKLGLEPEFQTISAPNYYEQGDPVDVVNVTATIPGSANTGAVALVAHYDTVPATPGANDNSAAVATLLESGRAILAGPQLRNDVILLFTDSEEPNPRYGSEAFVRESPAFDKIALVVNLEALGGSGPSSLAETSGSETWLVDQYAAAVSNPAAFSFVSEITALVGDVGTDFDSFRNAGVPGFHFAYMRGSPIYHLPTDNLESVGWDSVQHHGSNTLGIAQHFGDLALGTVPDSSESVYFTLRPFFVQYAAWWSLAAALLATALLLLGFVRSVRRRTHAAGSLARSSGIALLLTFVATVVATLVWLLIVAIRSTPSVLEAYAYFILSFGIGASVAFWLNNRAPIKRHMTGPTFLVLWVALGLLTAFAAAGLSPLFTLPALAGAIAYNWHTGREGWGAILRFTVVAAPTVVLLTPAIDFFFQFGQPRPGNPDSSIPSVAAVAFLLAVLAGGLLMSVWRESNSGIGTPGRYELPATPH